MKRLLMAAQKSKWVKYVPKALVLIFVFFIAISVYDALYQYKEDTGIMLATDIEKLATIFKKIDDTAGILSFDYQKNPINFLTIKADGFVSSEVGPVNLVHPKKWQGPYVQHNPVMQGKEYQIVSTKKGYFIVPGEGVVLPSKKIIGKDILFDENADIQELVRNGELMFEGKPLAKEITIGGPH